MTIKTNNEQLNKLIKDTANQIADLNSNVIGKTVFVREMHDKVNSLLDYLKNSNLKKLDAGNITPILQLLKKEKMSYAGMCAVIETIAKNHQLLDDTGTVENLLRKHFFEPVFNNQITTLIDFNTVIMLNNNERVHPVRNGNSLFVSFILNAKEDSHLEQYALKFLSEKKANNSDEYFSFINLLNRIDKNLFKRKNIGDDIDNCVTKFEDEYML